MRESSTSFEPAAALDGPRRAHFDADDATGVAAAVQALADAAGWP